MCNHVSTFGNSVASLWRLKTDREEKVTLGKDLLGYTNDQF
jgi:hypothetical protein